MNLETIKQLYNMENLYIKGSSEAFFIPTVDFNAETGHCILSGESYLEDTVEFYEPLIKWVRQYTEDIKKPITFDIKLTYYNTSSSRSILDILDILKAYEDLSGFVTVNWHYDEEEQMDIEEEVEDYIIESGLEINLIPYKD